MIGLVEQRPVNRVQIVETRRLPPLADRELAFLQPVGDIPELRDRKAVRHAVSPSRPFFEFAV